jgi:teichuronic acid biosynthesis glycosyltransferase TuaG
MTKELVSIILLSEKKERHLIETIRSVQAQTYENWELLYVDDTQQNDSLKLMMEEKAVDSRIHISSFVFRNGLARARTAALRDAKGRWITFIDAGDLWEPTKLEKQIAFMKEHDYALSYTKYRVVDKNGNDRGVMISGPEQIDNALMKECYWNQLLTVMYDTEKIGELIIPNLVENNGYAVMLLLSEKADFHLMDESLARLRTAKGLFSRVPFLRKFVWRFVAYRAVCKLGRIESIVKTFVNIWYTLVKRVKYVEYINS